MFPRDSDGPRPTLRAQRPQGPRRSQRLLVVFVIFVAFVPERLSPADVLGLSSLEQTSHSRDVRRVLRRWRLRGEPLQVRTRFLTASSVLQLHSQVVQRIEV